MWKTQGYGQTGIVPALPSTPPHPWRELGGGGRVYVPALADRPGGEGAIQAAQRRRFQLSGGHED